MTIAQQKSKPIKTEIKPKAVMNESKRLEPNSSKNKLMFSCEEFKKGLLIFLIF